MSTRIDRCFTAAADTKRKVLIPFITAGDPQPSWTVNLMHRLVAGGADLLELGIPFSDPMADGPVIQASSERAVARNVDLAQVLGWVREFRREDQVTPVVLMGYMNPFERFGYSRLASETANSGVDGLLLVDCPPEEMPDLQDSLDHNGICSIRLVAPTTTAERLTAICQGARGFIYYVSFKGTTGAGHLETGALATPIARIKEQSDLPVAVGFGIKDADSAVAAAEHSDGVVIGSALVAALAECDSLETGSSRCENFISRIRHALDTNS